ncbi:MAG: oligopeptide transporter, OPT family [Gammaproteobacteria bacterium]
MQSGNNVSVPDTPFISANQTLAEITLKAVILAVIITAILGAANAYLALKLGQTISASIPAAVIAMGALRFFRKHNILENNIVQTAAAAGEGVAAAISFVLPALLITGYWSYFHYWETAAMTATGGLLGVLFSIPLRRVMLNYPTLRFPEGAAIGNVLKSSATGSAKMSHLIQGGAVGGIIALSQSGFKFLSESMSLWFTGNKMLFGTSLGFSPALLGAGFIVGIQACIGMLVGLVLAWFIGMPIITHFYGLPQASSLYDMAMTVRAEHIRYIGVGTMLFGGAWTLITLVRPIIDGVSTSFKSFSLSRMGQGAQLLRTERDIPIHFVLMGIIILAVVAYFVLRHLLNFEQIGLSGHLTAGFTALTVVYMLVLGFVLASVCAYLTGLVGITNNPLSGLMLGSVLISSLLILALFGHHIQGNAGAIKAAVSIVIIITTMVSTIVVISGENLQDLKAGQMVGATPWKQQVMLLMGVVISAIVVGPVLELLFQAYGIGGTFPRAGMDPSQALSAPQAALMAALASGAFGHNLPTLEISIGMAIALVALFIDEYLKRRGYRLPILAIGIGIYLPTEITTVVVLGGVLNYVAKRIIAKREHARGRKPNFEAAFENGTLVACGLVAGAALMGVLLAIPFVLKGSSDALRLMPTSLSALADWLGVISLVALSFWLVRVTCRPAKEQR